MSEQDGAQSSTKQRRSRKTSTANQQNGKQAPAVQRPANDDKEAWEAYWKTQGQPWRTQPEIDEERQKYLAERRSITPDIKQGIYPFKDIKLSRADVEWLLATHENGRGPVDWSDENQRERIGIDLRGAQLKGVILSGLPLARMRGMLMLNDEWRLTTRIERRMAVVHLEEADLRGAHLEGAELRWANLKRALLDKAHLEQAQFASADLERAELHEVHAEGADFRVVNLEGAFMYDAHLEGAIFRTAHMEKARLAGAHLEGANLYQAHLEGSDLRDVHLEGANLGRAHLESAHLIGAHLEGKEVPSDDLERIRNWNKDFPALLQPADLQEAFFDSGTRLNGATLGNRENGFVTLADISWGGINLAVMDWWQVKMLGDERIARQDKTSDLIKQESNYRKAVRANRQLAKTLQDQGLNEVSSYFARRGQILQRKVLWLDLQLPEKSLGLKVLWFNGYIFSWLLDLLAGYGYKPQRSLLSYVLVVTTFSISYYILGQTVGPHFSPLGALVFSITSFHGRGFFPGGVQLDDPITVLAALEAMVGLAIEVSLIATFTQRFFGK